MVHVSSEPRTNISAVTEVTVTYKWWYSGFIARTEYISGLNLVVPASKGPHMLALPTRAICQANAIQICFLYGVQAGVVEIE